VVPAEDSGYDYPSFYSPPPSPSMFANGFCPAGLGYSDYDRQPQAGPSSFRAPLPPPRAEAGYWWQPPMVQCFEPWPLAPEQSIAADEILYGRGPRSRPRLPVFEAICPTEPCHQLRSSPRPPSAGCCEIASASGNSSKRMTL
jgi:hypothetical protein